jgi:hypothetical protein
MSSQEASGEVWGVKSSPDGVMGGSSLLTPCSPTSPAVITVSYLTRDEINVAAQN